MIGNAQHKLCAQLGFLDIAQVATQRSIAPLFGTRSSRCGIYLLELTGQRYYIGQAVDVVRRFGQHRQHFDDIMGFAFMPMQASALEDAERAAIRKAEDLGLMLLNTVHVANVYADTDLDMVVSPQEQQQWLKAPGRFNNSDRTIAPAVSWAQQVRFEDRYNKYLQHPLAESTSALLRSYIYRCIPAPQRTVYAFWVVSCCPSTNQSTAPRMVCVSAAGMELFVVGYHKNRPHKFWGFVIVAGDIFCKTFGTLQTIKAQLPGVTVNVSDYRDAGQHQLNLHARDAQCMVAMLKNPVVQQAAATLALRVMRKRPTIFSKFHCCQLADAVFARSAAQPLHEP